MASFQIGKYTSGVDAKKAAIEAARAKAPSASDAVLVKYIPPGECPDRNRIIFDDSGSMAGYIQDAKKGVTEYLRNCVPNTTAVAVHFMNSGEIKLQSDLIALAVEIQEKRLDSGGTPFFNTLKKALETVPRATRLVAFTDGSPTDELQSEKEEPQELIGYYDARINAWKASANVIITIAKSFDPEKCIPIDTVFFGSQSNEREINLLKYLSDQTGGIFLHFDPAKMNFATAFKYLAPVYRAQLTDGNFRAAVERGEKK